MLFKFQPQLWYTLIAAGLAATVVVVATGWYVGLAGRSAALAVPTYLSPQLGVLLQYPAGWRPVSGYDGADGLPLRFAGRDGFWQLMAATGDGILLTDAATQLTGHQLKPFGDNPLIKTVVVAGQPAAMIAPRQAGIAEAALVIAYPEPIVIAHERYRFLVLQADLNHLEPLASSLRFINSQAGGLKAVPNILVYAPFPGALVETSVTVAGVARVFESNVSLKLVDAEGREVWTGFATAQASEVGAYGAFTAAVPLPKAAPAGTKFKLIAFQLSAQDGAAQDEVTVPLMVK